MAWMNQVGKSLHDFNCPEMRLPAFSTPEFEAAPPESMCMLLK